MHQTPMTRRTRQSATERKARHVDGKQRRRRLRRRRGQEATSNREHFPDGTGLSHRPTKQKGKNRIGKSVPAHGHLTRASPAQPCSARRAGARVWSWAYLLLVPRGTSP
ncbi:hypothetical protein Taro_002996 [Colocasia esculenta]|uniref:Uncharacterized protein n=1 Tax=Colocasia esculenta TaxID=4460 RepID=A0A843TKC6_COLES|nr:hypothetical protein [Colocasia esculenta]